MKDDTANTKQPRTPGELLIEQLEKRGWSQEDLAKIIDRPAPRITELVQGKLSISPELALSLESAFGIPAEEWLRLEAEHLLSSTPKKNEEVKRRARLYELAPIKELQKRGWLQKTDKHNELERELLRFLEIRSIDEEPCLAANLRKTAPNMNLNPSQRAWCFRVRQLAKSLTVAQFKEDRLNECEQKLRKLAAYPQEVSKVPIVLAAYGIRFVVVEPLSSGKIDGMADWLDEQSPVIGMSLRFDRVDSFWHTLFHEFSHIRNKDGLSVDSDVNSHDEPPLIVKSPVERRADEEAAASLIPSDEMKSFILRVGPLYSKERIIQFAHKVKVHPGIIVGQLQHRGEIGYSANRGMLAKIRNTLIDASVTDGYGHSIDPRVLNDEH